MIEERGDEETLARLGSSYRDRELFYLPDHPRVAEAFEAFGSRPGLLYVALAASDEEVGPHAPTLTFNELEPDVAAGWAPDWILRPFRSLAPWLLAGGLACYVLLPRRRRREGALRYGRMQAIVMPDVLATMLLVVFFALPLLVMGQWGGSVLELSGAWIPVLVFWILLLAPLVIYAITAKNESFSAELDDDALRIRRWNGRATIAFDEIDSVRAATWSTPGWLKAFGWLGFLLSWRGLVPALILEQGGGAGIEIVRKDGSAGRIWLAGLAGWKRLVSTLETKGAKVTEEVRKLLAADTE